MSEDVTTSTQVSRDDSHCDEPESKKPRLAVTGTSCETTTPDQSDVISAREVTSTEDPDPKEAGDEVEGKEETEVTEEGVYMREHDMGITEYISTHKGFHAIIKQRYSDFIVNEIDMDGKVVHLTDVTVQKDEMKEKESTKPDSSHVGVVQTLSYIRVGGEDKQRRKKLHQAVREGFPELCSTTQDSNIPGCRVIRCEREKQGYQYRCGWPRHRPPYLKFVLYKENKDTMNTIDLISRNLRMKSKSFAYAGTKDRRAKTTQEVTVFKTSAEKLNGMNKILRNIAVGNYRYVDNCLRLGNLTGNHFTIVLREVSASDEVIMKVKDSMIKSGFINYYGMQRFGTTNIPTHYIGRALLQKDWEKAVDLILRPRLGEPEGIRECRECWQNTKDVDKILENLPKSYNIEWLILQGLKKFGLNNYFQAFTMVPRNNRLMYVHSYQSYIWNKIVSKRIKLHGLAVIEGDLVITKENLEEEDMSWEESIRVNPVQVTSANLQQYSIHDVVLPLPGYAVNYPTNDIRQWYENLLAEDDLKMGSFKTSHRDYSLPGAYRKIMVQPANLTCETCMYDDYTQPLVLSDLDKIKGVTLPENNSNEGKYKAIKLEMSLPTSSYATMALREMLKTDTSSAHQSTLNPCLQT
ncbi:hypothetical protein ScPMuIL_007667 [Solemya velum]